MSTSLTKHIYTHIPYIEDRLILTLMQNTRNIDKRKKKTEKP